MTIYLIEIVFILALWPLSRYRIRIGNDGKKICGKEVYLFIVFLMLGIVMALRSKNVGTDTTTYYIINQKINNSASFVDALSVSTLESAPLYVLYSYGLSKIFDSSQAILIFNSFIISVGFYRFIKKTSSNYMYSSLLFLLLTLYFESMNGMRQFVSIALALNAFILLKEDIKSIKGWLIYIGAILIHTTAIAFIIAIVGIIIVKTTKSIVKIIPTTIAICIGVTLGMRFLVDVVVRFVPILAQYIDGSNNAQLFNNSGSGRIVILYLILLLIMIVISIQIKGKVEFKKTVDYSYFPPLYFCAISGIVFSKNILFCRILWYFLSLYIPFIPNMYELLFRGKNKRLLYVGTSLVLLVYCIFHLLEDKSGIIPYSTFWSFNI